MLYCVYPSILFLLSLCLPLVRSFICSEDVYGSPNVDDCKQALLEVPFARKPGGDQARYSHVFAEPQFQEPPFSSVTNNLRPQAIVQLPRIWKHNSCRIALLSQGVPGKPEVVSPRFIATWRNVFFQSELLRRCLASNPPQGGWTSFWSTQRVAAGTLYMYDSDSAFSIIMNSYMSDGVPVVPIRDGLGFDVLGNATLSSPTANVITNLTRTLLPSEYKLLDSK